MYTLLQYFKQENFKTCYCMEVVKKNGSAGGIIIYIRGIRAKNILNYQRYYLYRIIQNNKRPLFSSFLYKLAACYL